MPKGFRHETCAEAILSEIRPDEVVPFSLLYARVHSRGMWRKATILQHLMSCVVNLPPARQHWTSQRPFLFLRPDGRYELYDPNKHPQVIV
jgi:hypothetical protein